MNIHRFLLIILAFIFIGFSFYNFTYSENEKIEIIKTPQKNTWISSQNYFNALSVEFLDGQRSAQIYLPSYEEPIDLHLDQEDAKRSFSQLVITPKIQSFYLEVEGKINVHLYNSKKPYHNFLAGSLDVNGLKVISRKEWGADESIRYNYSAEGAAVNAPSAMSSTEAKCSDNISKYPSEYVYDKVVTNELGNRLIWPRQYSKKIQKIIVHHTAESDKSSNIPGGDKIRSIYYYHAKSKGWGDIGYNFLIDQDGNIYEGRSGGDFVVGGHAYCSNVNTMGIALMGNFMRNDTPKAQLASLVKLVSALSKKYNLNVSKENTFHGVTSSTLVGHKDVRATACPGDNLYKILPVIRKQFSFLQESFSLSKSSLKPKNNYAAKLDGKLMKIDLGPIENKKITIPFKNTGIEPWGKGTWLYISNNDNRVLWADSIILDKNYVAADLREDNVYPGQVGHFDVTINTGLTAGEYWLSFTPIINGERKLDSAMVDIPISISKPHFDYVFVKSDYPKNPLFYGQIHKPKLYLKNSGTTKWLRSGYFATTIAAPANAKSPFANPKTPHTLAWLEQNAVYPGEVGVFEFDLHSGFKEGIYDFVFLPRVGVNNFMKDSGMKYELQVEKPNYKAQILYNSKHLSFNPGETKTVKIGLRNLSNVDWQENQVSLRVIDSDGLTLQESNYYFSDFVRIDDSSSIDFTIKAPYKFGDYQIKFQVLANGKKFNEIRWVKLPVKVIAPVLEGKITHLSKNNIQLSKDDTEEIILRVKNYGNIMWEKEGSNAIRLVSDKKHSQLKASSWAGQIVQTMENDFVKPKKVATFKFKIQKGTNNNINEKMHLALKSLGKIEGTSFDLRILASDVDKRTSNRMKEKKELFLLEKKKKNTLEKRDESVNKRIKKSSSRRLLKKRLKINSTNKSSKKRLKINSTRTVSKKRLKVGGHKKRLLLKKSSKKKDYY